MPGAPYLRGERLTLRLVAPADYEFVAEHWNDPRVRDGAPLPTPLSADDVGGFVEGADDAQQFLACDGDDRVGFAMLFDIEPEASHAELGFWVVPGERGQGYGTEAAALCVEHAFADRGLHKVSARVFAGNEVSKAVLEALGFEHEGRLREHYYARGAHRDMDVYGLLATDWGGAGA